jgi:hypothetical protein
MQLHERVIDYAAGRVRPVGRTVARQVLFSLVSATSGVLCATTIVFWVLSYHTEYNLDRLVYSGEYVETAFNNGGAYLCWGFDNFPIIRGPHWMLYTAGDDAWEENFGIPSRRWQGVRWFSVVLDRRNPPEHVVILSNWLLAALFGILPWIWVRRFRERKLGPA